MIGSLLSSFCPSLISRFAEEHRAALAVRFELEPFSAMRRGAFSSDSVLFCLYARDGTYLSLSDERKHDEGRVSLVPILL